MLRIKRASNILTLTIVTLILLSCLPGNVSAQDALDPVVVVYDASHRPKFDADDDLNGLKLMFDMVNASTRYVLKVNTGTITNETLSDADILIVGNNAFRIPRHLFFSLSDNKIPVIRVN